MSELYILLMGAIIGWAGKATFENWKRHRELQAQRRELEAWGKGAAKAARVLTDREERGGE